MPVATLAIVILVAALLLGIVIAARRAGRLSRPLALAIVLAIVVLAAATYIYPSALTLARPDEPAP